MARNNRAGTGRSSGTGRNRMNVRNDDPDLKPENMGLSRREIRALEAENHGARFFRRGVISSRAARARRG